MSEPSVAVIVPSYRRPQALACCLEALKVQTVSPARIVVAIRAGDVPTGAVVRRFQRELDNLEVAFVEVPGVVAAIRAAAARCTEDVVAHTDDDAAPRRDWIERMLALYTDDVGAVGGRDVIHNTTSPPSAAFEDAAQSKRTVGRITWFGRVIGNHHLGVGPARDVHILKGANMSMRRELWILDSALKGAGAQVAWEMGVCLRALRGGWRVIYDPGLAVDHYPAARFDEDQRGRPSVRARLHAEWNQCYVLARHTPLRIVGQASIYQLAVGCGTAPGPLGLLVALSRRSPSRRGTVRACCILTWVRLRAVVHGLSARATHAHYRKRRARARWQPRGGRGVAATQSRRRASHDVDHSTSGFPHNVAGMRFGSTAGAPRARRGGKGRRP